MSLKPCKFTPKGSKELSYDEFRQYLLDNYDGLVEPPTGEEAKEGPKKKFRGTIETFVENSDLPEDLKERMRQDPRSYMEQLSFEEAQTITRSLIESLGGIDNALADVNSLSSQIPLELQSIVYGEALLDAKAKTEAATTVEEKDKWAAIENEIHQRMGEKATQAGRYISYIGKFYAQGAYALVYEHKKQIEAENKAFAAKAKEGAKAIDDIFENKTEEAKEDTAKAVEEAVQKAVEQTAKEKDKIIADLEKKIADFRKDAKTTKPKTAPKQRRFSADRLAELRKQATGKISANPFLDPAQWEYLSYAAGYYLESGYLKFADFYKKMSKETKGKAEEYFAELYEQAKARLIEDGYTEGDFDSAEAVERIADEMADSARAIREELEREKKAKAETKRFEGRGLEKTIREALIEAGYGKEVAGKQQVDWRKVTGESKLAAPIVEKVKKALEGKIPEADLARLMPIIEAEADRLITQKKAKAIETKIKQYEGRRRRGLLNRIKRNTRIQGLVETWKQGGLTNKVILEKLASDFGIITFTAEDEAFVQDLVEQIDAAQPGAERERLEERLQAYLEYNGHPRFLAKVFFERNKSRLLSGTITFIKNLSGSLDAMTDVFFNAMAAQVDQVKAKGLSGLGDKQIFKAAYKAHKKAWVTAMDALLRGGVDMGTAMSEITGNKEGSPSVRWMENPRSDFPNQQIVAKNLRRGVTKFERVFMRAMSAADTFNQVMVQEASSYRFIKAALTEQYPDRSSKEINEMAYEIAFGDQLSAARIQAAKEFTDRNVEVTGVVGRNRMERRAYEIVEQAREKEAEGVTRSAQLAGNIATYKAPDYGIYSGIGAALKWAISGVNTQISRKRDAALKAGNTGEVKFWETASFLNKFMTDFAVPFVGVLGNIMEKGKELTPYGYLKAGAHAFRLGNKNSRPDAIEKMAYYSFKATLGLVLSAIALGLADEDDEDEMAAIYGEGAPNISEKINRQKQRPENTIVINGNRIPLDLLGSWGMPIKHHAQELDAERYNKREMQLIAEYVYTANSIWFETPGRIIKALTSDKEYKREKEYQRLGAEILTRSVIPGTSFVRQTGQMISPKAKNPTNFTEQLLKYSGLTGLLGREAVDYRGKTYDTGQIYSSSADGFIKMFSDAIKIDAVDELVFQYHPGIMAPIRSGEDYQIMTDGKYTPMSQGDFYDVSKKSGQNLDKLLNLYAKNPVYKNKEVTDSVKEKYYRRAEEAIIEKGLTPTEDNIRVQVGKIYDEESKADGIKNEISDLNTLAKDAAIEWYYKNRGLRVPFDKEGSIRAYEEEIAVLEQRAKKR